MKELTLPISSLLIGATCASAQLYDNGPLATPGSTSAACLPLGALASEVQTGNTIAGWNILQGASANGGYHVIDDFVVPASQTWRIKGFRFYLYAIDAGTPTVNDIRVRIWSDLPSAAGAVIAGDMETNRLTGNAFTSVYRILTGECSAARRVQEVRGALSATLGPGAYWVEWTASGGNSGPWAPAVTIEGQVGRPGANAHLFTGWFYVPISDGATPQDLPFVIEGCLAGCYPDCNEDCTLTVQDFGCFQTRFVQAAPYADCNADGSLTVADFGCFQTKFVAGCP